MLTDDQVLYDIEVHSPEGIRRCFEQGSSPNDLLSNGTPLFTMMVEMYTRTPRFKDCVQAFIDHGLQFEQQELLAVFIDDAGKLDAMLKTDPALVAKTYSLFNNTYTPLTGGTLLHFCAEYNSINCAKALVHHGADVNAKTALDENGFGGHTPIFHTVNQNSNNSKDMLHFLLEQGVDLAVTVRGLIWGKGYEWETFIPAVNPISYAMMGLLPQMHRKDTTVAETISLLLKYAYGIDYTPPNVPNKYLQ
ncbi:MAG TPA: ankyrin repeat domain-containing protein [Mucilaginibacter sp.]|nr:ankyrin repeat domain-containing protein [Mucilaginibacter sp.]